MNLSLRHVLYSGLTLALLLVIGWSALRDSSPLPYVIPKQDKFEHLLAFAAMHLWLTVLFRGRYLGRITLVCVLAAFGVEIAQWALTTTREPSWKDAVASLLGVFSAAAFQILVRRLVRMFRAAKAE